MSVHIDHQAAMERACTRLIAHYAYLNDQRRFEELAGLFTPDAVLFRPSAGNLPSGAGRSGSDPHRLRHLQAGDGLAAGPCPVCATGSILPSGP